MTGLDDSPLTTEAAALFLNMSVDNLRNWRKRNIGPSYIAIRMGSQRTIYRYRPADLRAFMEAHAVRTSRLPHRWRGRPLGWKKSAPA